NNLTTDLITQFLSIPPAQATNIDQLISTSETALSNASANTIIQTLQPLSSLTRITTGINFASIIADLQITSQTIQNSVLENLFSQQCQDVSDNTVAGPENWLQRFYSYLENKQSTNETDISCPFCKQTIDFESDIITAYAGKFNTA